MARIRNVKPDMFIDDDLCQRCSFAARWLYVALFCQADKAGRVEDRPAKIKMTCLPYDDVDVDALLSELARERFIVRYEANEHRYIQIRTWSKHQRPHHTESESLIPSPDVTCLDNGYETVRQPLRSGENPLGKGKEIGKETETGMEDALKRDPVTGYVVGPARISGRQHGGLMPGRDPSSAFRCAAFKVPHFLHGELAERLTNAGVSDPEAELRAWYGRLRDENVGREMSSDSLNWLRKQFDIWRKVAPVVPASRADDDGAARLRAWAAKGQATA